MSHKLFGEGSPILFLRKKKDLFVFCLFQQITLFFFNGELYFLLWYMTIASFRRNIGYSQANRRPSLRCIRICWFASLHIWGWDCFACSIIITDPSNGLKDDVVSSMFHQELFGDCGCFLCVRGTFKTNPCGKPMFVLEFLLQQLEVESPKLACQVHSPHKICGDGVEQIQGWFQGPPTMGPSYGKFPILFPYHSHKNP